MAKTRSKSRRILRGLMDETGLTTPKPIARRKAAKKPVKQPLRRK